MTTLTEYRCPHCNRLLFKAQIITGVVEIKCLCNRLVTLRMPPATQVYATDWHGMATQTSTQTPAEAHEKGLTLTVTK